VELFNSKLYVGTNEGLYVLDKITDLVALKKIIEKQNKAFNRKKESKPTVNSLDNVSSTKKKKSSIFYRLFSAKSDTEKETASTSYDTKKSEKKSKKFFGFLNKKDKSDSNSEKIKKDGLAKTEPKENVKNNQQKNNNPKKETKPIISKPIVENQNEIDFSLQTFKYHFVKIEGVNGKVKSIKSIGERLIVVTNVGLYEVVGTKSNKIFSEPVQYLEVLDNTTIYVATENKKIIIFRNINSKWEIVNTIQQFNEKILKLYIARNNTLWVIMHNEIKIYSSNDFEKSFCLKLENPYSDDISLVELPDKMMVFISDRVFNVNKKTFEIEENKSFFEIKSSFLRIINSQKNIIWYNVKDTWNFYSGDLVSNPNYAYLGLINDIQNIWISSDSKSLWVSTKNNQLYKIDISQKEILVNQNSVFLKSVIDKKGTFVDTQKIELKQESGSVSFTFSIPDFLDNESIQYQYLLVGLTNDWSDWSTDNKINFNFLPPGTYSLKVRTKNSLNQIKESQEIFFKVRPPYWQEWWFYLSEVLFFGTLLGLSIYLNRVRHQKIKWLSTGLTFLTIVMLIEFVNTVFESYFDVSDSPVLSFLLQVFLAILIFPFERILSSMITQSPEHTLNKFSLAKRLKKRNIIEDKPQNT
jgi:TM2 domain-containing membrane protein YozV